MIFVVTLSVHSVRSTNGGVQILLKGVPKLNGIMQQGSETSLSISPAKNVSGYIIRCESNGKKIEEFMYQSGVEFIKLQNNEKLEIKSTN